MKEETACTCQSCGMPYKFDLMIPNHLWEKIKPAGKPEGAGLLCGKCIIEALEKLGHGYMEVTPPTESIQPMTWEQAKLQACRLHGLTTINESYFSEISNDANTIFHSTNTEVLRRERDDARMMFVGAQGDIEELKGELSKVTQELRDQENDTKRERNEKEVAQARLVEITEENELWETRCKQLENTLSVDPSFVDYMNETRRDFVSKTIGLLPHESKPDDAKGSEAWTTGRVSAEDMLICFDQMREKLTAVLSPGKGDPSQS